MLEFLEALYIFMCQKRKEINWVHLERREFSWAMVKKTKGYRIYVVGQREVVISHDVTFNKDMALTKVNNLLTLRSSQEADTRELKEKDDESMPNVEEPMDLIDPHPHELSSSRKRPSWLRGTLDDAKGYVAP